MEVDSGGLSYSLWGHPITCCCYVLPFPDLCIFYLAGKICIDYW